jgi:hypothetical protein
MYKVHPITVHEGPEREQMYSSTLPSTSALMWVGGQRHATAALPPGKAPGTHCIGGPVWTGAENLALHPPTPPGFDPQTVASHYTDWAIPALVNKYHMIAYHIKANPFASWDTKIPVRWAPQKHPGRKYQIGVTIRFCTVATLYLWVLSMELSWYHFYGAYNFEVPLDLWKPRAALTSDYHCSIDTSLGCLSDFPAHSVRILDVPNKGFGFS